MFDKVDDLLSRERTALLTADFTALPSILKEKIILMEMVKARGFRRGDLRKLSDKALHNQTLLNEAMAGIRSTAKTLAELKASKRTIETYDRTGKRRTLRPDVDTSVEKKA